MKVFEHIPLSIASYFKTLFSLLYSACFAFYFYIEVLSFELRLEDCESLIFFFTGLASSSSFLNTVTLCWKRFISVFLRIFFWFWLALYTTLNYSQGSCIIDCSLYNFSNSLALSTISLYSLSSSSLDMVWISAICYVGGFISAL